MQAGNEDNHSTDERLYSVLEATDFLPPKDVNRFIVHILKCR